MPLAILPLLCFNIWTAAYFVSDKAVLGWVARSFIND